MLPNLFDIEGRKCIPSQACYIVPWLKRIIDKYPNNFIQVYTYLFLTSCPDATLNPYMNFPEEDREDIVIADLKPLTFSLEDPIIIDTLSRLFKMYETPTLRIWRSAKIMLDEMATKLSTKSLTFGKDGNAADMRGMMKELPTFTENYMKLENMLKEEQSKVKGDRIIPFHQKEGYKETKNYDQNEADKRASSNTEKPPTDTPPPTDNKDESGKEKI